MSIDYKKQTIEFWKKHLEPEIYNICRTKGTERAFSGKYDKHFEKGIYYCACCGGDYPLFISETKFDSGTGWPSFWAPINKDNITLSKEKQPSNLLRDQRIEVACSRCDAHLGHVFDDGPLLHTGKRYCMNSLALIFVQSGAKAENKIIKK